ncbi:MAG: xylulokinase [Kiritimatiellia bacterium]
MCRGLAQSLAKLRRHLGEKWLHVAGVGLAAQGGSTIIVEAATGRPLTPMLLWNDQRALRFWTELRESRPVSFWRHLMFRDSPGMGLARMLYFRETQPELLDKANLYVGAGEYAFYQLTRVWRQDACNALQIGCYNAARECIERRLLDLVHIPSSFVAPLRRGHETTPLASEGAARFGLTAGIPVAGPYMDHEAGYLSALDVSAKPLQCSLGTAWVGNFTVPPTLRSFSAHQLVLPPILGDGGRLNVQPLLTGNVTWDWGLGNLVHSNQRRALTLAETLFSERLLPRQGLVALPWLNVANPVLKDALGGAAFIGVGPSTDRGDLLRALAVGMTCEMRRVFDACCEHGIVDCLVLGGGASKGEFFRILLAALFHPLPVFYLEEQEFAGTRGALHVFGPKVSLAASRPVPTPNAELVQEVQKYYRNYLDVFGRVYADSRQGCLSFKTEKSFRAPRPTERRTK